MIAHRGLARLGPIMQMAYVPADIDAALAYWTGTMGVGPFFALEHVALEATRYCGVPTEIDFSLYIAYWGELQIELIQQHNAAPSIYRTWLDAGRTGLHHVCLLVDDFAPVRAVVERDRLLVAQSALVPGGGEVVYVQPDEADPSSMVEVLKPGPGAIDLFAMMKNAATGWDGTDAVRRLG